MHALVGIHEASEAHMNKRLSAISGREVQMHARLNASETRQAKAARLLLEVPRWRPLEAPPAHAARPRRLPTPLALLALPVLSPAPPVSASALPSPLACARRPRPPSSSNPQFLTLTATLTAPLCAHAG